MPDKIKIKVSSFVADVLESDAVCFNFQKNGQPNKNALLNKIIPILVAVRKERREQIDYILKNEYNRNDSENIFNAVNTVIDRVYFNDEKLNYLEEYIWFRPSKQALSAYDEIQISECLITAQDLSTYVRGLLNEYCRLPRYKREALVFDAELEIFAEGCVSHQILHFKDKSTNKRIRAFAFNYYYSCLFDENNYCVIYDLNEKTIKSIPLCNLQDMFLINQKYKPQDKLKDALNKYADNLMFDQEINMEDGDVF